MKYKNYIIDQMMLSFVEYFKKGDTTMQNIVNVIENNHEKIV